MISTAPNSKFNPYHRVITARCILKGTQQRSEVSDIWTHKLADMLELRTKFNTEYGEAANAEFEKRYPLYANLLNIHEDNRSGGDRDLVEAALLCTNDYEAIADALNNDKYSATMLSLYGKLFFDVSDILGNAALEFQTFVRPMLSATTDKLAIGHIWKLLALHGGLGMLVKKGLGTSPIKAEDIEYLLQLAGFRHCSNLLQYVGAGSSFFKDNPTAALALNSLADFDTIRSASRRADFMAKLSDVSKNNFSSILSGELKLISAPDAALRQLAELDGTFNPDSQVGVEYTKHVTFISEDTNDEN